jgi:hypothetical protein
MTMSADDLDRCYTELCHALARLGEPKTASFLSTLCLALLARQAAAPPLLELIAQVERQCGAPPTDDTG